MIRCKRIDGPERTASAAPPPYENCHTPEILKDIFANWTIEELVEYENDVAEGLGHHGRSTLIGMVACEPATLDR
ncbi:MAG: hypothetical protein Q7U80_04860 [Thiobacillus sp.]|nr:hypothetical protein [Thiobacillus sp.]